MSGGEFRVTGGFWALPVAVQGTNAPALAIAAAAPGFAMISWNPPEQGWVLQERPGFETNAWVNAPSGSQNPVTVPATFPAKFYRLSRP
ncbi:MAG TPA: hypothetical protein PKE47_01375 [Verrucomicrobiota bacterium]|nr:hypothetical protein [Verrucomicrobiota bacterium]